MTSANDELGTLSVDGEVKMSTGDFLTTNSVTGDSRVTVLSEEMELAYTSSCIDYIRDSIGGCGMDTVGRGISLYNKWSWLTAALKKRRSGAKFGLPVIVYVFLNSWPERRTRAKSIHSDCPVTLFSSKKARLPNHYKPNVLRHS